MGVYIKGMEMPDCCLDCPLYNGHGCKATLQMFHPITNVAVRIEGCPLIEVKTPHGRLIDADIVEEELKAIEEIMTMVDIELGDDPEEGEISIPLFTIRNIHNKAKSVIEAEESE